MTDLAPDVAELLEYDADTLEHFGNIWTRRQAAAARRALRHPAHARRARGRKIEVAIEAAIKAYFLQDLADTIRRRRPDEVKHPPKLKHVLTAAEIRAIYQAAVNKVKAETKDAPPTPAQTGDKR